MSVFVFTDPSEQTTFSLLNTSPVKEGDNVTMKCETDGNPQPEFEYSKDVRIGSYVVFLLLSMNDITNMIILLLLYFDPCVLSPIHFQKKRILGQKEIVMLKSVKRTDAGVYKCEALDFDNLEGDLIGTINLTVHCE